MRVVDSNTSHFIEHKIEKYTLFTDWLVSNGAKFDDVQFPSFFLNGQLMGIAAKNHIAPHRCFIAIPNTCIISVAKVWQSDLSPFLKKHPQIFS